MKLVMGLSWTKEVHSFLCWSTVNTCSMYCHLFCLSVPVSVRKQAVKYISFGHNVSQDEIVFLSQWRRIISLDLRHRSTAIRECT